MAHVNFGKKELNCKLVYCGPALSGKTTNLEFIHRRAPPEFRGELCSVATEGDRTLFFDYMPVDLGELGGVRTRFQVYTVPGQVYYASTRRLVLQGVDGVVFVADSRRERLGENLAALEELGELLDDMGRDPRDLPLVMQWNKRDLDDVLPLDELEERLNGLGAPSVPAIAAQGQGVLTSLKLVARRVLARHRSDRNTLAGGATPGTGRLERVLASAPSGAAAELSEGTAAAPPGAPAERPQAPRPLRTKARREAKESSRRPAAGREGAQPRPGSVRKRRGSERRRAAEGAGPDLPPTPAQGNDLPNLDDPAELARVLMPSASGPDARKAAGPVGSREAAALARALMPSVSRSAALAPAPAADAPPGPAAAEEPGEPRGEPFDPIGSNLGGSPPAPGSAPACPWSSADETPLAPPPVEDEDADPVIGQVVGSCRIHSRLGEGGMGAVYLARHPGLEKDVVVKVLKPEYANNRRRVKRFFLEARAAAKLEHPNIVAIKDVGTNERGLHYIVMQYVEGRNLFERIRAKGRHPVRRSLQIVLAVARALVAMHERGVVHRDIKAENVVITPSGEVKLIDFGLAKDLNANLNLTKAGAMVGTPLYMAPEIGRARDVDGRCDIYSLGLTLYFVLTGRPPFAGAAVPDVIFGRARLTPPEEIVRDLPRGVRAVLTKMLAWDRKERYADAAALVRDLAALVRGEEVEVATPCYHPIGAGEPPPLELVKAPGPAPQSLVVGSLTLGGGAPSEPVVAEAVPGDVAAAAPKAGAAPKGGGAGRRPRSSRSRRTAPGGNDQLGRYVLLSETERTFRGTVHRAWDSQAKCLVSLIVIEGKVRLSSGVRRDLQAVSRLHHPHLLALLDRGRAPDGRAYLVHEFVPGRSLSAVVAQDGALDPDAAARVVRDLARAVTYAGEHGLGHNWLRPSGVVLEDRGEALLGDLGLSAVWRRGGEPPRIEDDPFLPPEAPAPGAQAPAAEVYTLGALLYFALAGRPPEPAWSGVVQARPSRFAAGVLPDLDAIALKCLEAAPEARYGSAGELARDLDRVLHGEVPRVRPRPSLRDLPSVVTLPRDATRYALLSTAALLLVLLFALRSAWQRAEAAREEAQKLEARLERLESQQQRE